MLANNYTIQKKTSRRENSVDLTLNKSTPRVNLTNTQSHYVQLLISGIKSVTTSWSGNTLTGSDRTIYRCFFAPMAFEHTPLPKQKFQPLTLYNIILYTFTGPLNVDRFITRPTRVSLRTGKSHNTAIISCVSSTYKPPPPPAHRRFYLIPWPGNVWSCFHLSKINYNLLLWFTKSVPYFWI
jgi:hypothetical protein